MDRNRFDQLTRSVATGRSRREMLKLLIGGLAAGAFGAGLRSSASAQQAVDCVPACAQPLVCNALGQCVATCQESGQCSGQAACCIGFICSGSAESAVCVATCNTAGLACSPAGLDCCAELNLTCVEGTCCGGEGAACDDGFDCCAGLGCVDNTCELVSVCLAEGATCDLIVDECCANLECTDLGQGPICFDCIPEGEPCETIGCCEGLVCNEFMTACVPACQPAGEVCGLVENGAAVVAGPAPQLDCCDGLLCCDAGDAGECAECCGDGDCPTGTICCAGACREIECCIDDILTGGNPNDRCPDTCTCFEGICVDENQERCRAFCESDKECGKDTCCCKDGTCSATCCEAFVCASDKDCASGYCCCKDGSCSGTCCGSTPTTPPPGGGTIDTLPNTGTGDAASGPLNLAAGLTVAAGAAAAAARWRAKQSDPSP